MPTLKLRFPGGHYHATPWGHHVNEGLIEWPPSPWRLLRALIACGFSSQGWTEIPPAAQRLVNKLAEVLPSYQLPTASAAHTRHFMPVGKLKNGREETTLVFNSWANVGDRAMLINWPCELSSEESAELSRLAAALGYLGRSESWVEAELLPDNIECAGEFNAQPCRDGEHRGRQWEQISLLAATPPEDYRRRWEQQTKTALDQLPLPQGGKKPAAKLLRDREKAIAPYPPDLFSCLTKDTAWWKDYGWSQPPGSQRVLYWRESGTLQVGAQERPKARRVGAVTMMLLSLSTASRNRSALPICARTLPQAELFHRAIVGRVAKGGAVDCPELTGKDQQNQALRDHHAHAHILPVDLDGDGHLDHLIIYAPMGLGDAAQRAIRNLRRTWTKGGVGELQLAVVGSGDLAMLRELPSRLERQVAQLLGPSEGSQSWESVTPFVPPRFLKHRGKNTLLGQVNAELASRQLPEALSVQADADLTRKLRHYLRRRTRGAAPPPMDVGFGLRVVLSEPSHGPLLLGYASHYGLGLFRAVE